MPTNNTNTTNKPRKEIISPEGIEEQVVIEQTYRITLTQGGKYRTYLIMLGNIEESMGTDNTLEEARKHMAMGMTIYAGLILNPKLIIDTLLKELKEDKEKSSGTNNPTD